MDKKKIEAWLEKLTKSRLSATERYEERKAFRKDLLKFIKENMGMTMAMVVLGLLTCGGVLVTGFYILTYTVVSEWVDALRYPWNLFTAMCILSALVVLAMYLMCKTVDAVERFWDKRFGIKKP